jgi:hypothetical protein
MQPTSSFRSQNLFAHFNSPLNSKLLDFFSFLQFAHFLVQLLGTLDLQNLTILPNPPTLVNQIIPGKYGAQDAGLSASIHKVNVQLYFKKHLCHHDLSPCVHLLKLHISANKHLSSCTALAQWESYLGSKGKH